jgi:hypothetical protein
VNLNHRPGHQNKIQLAGHRGQRDHKLRAHNEQQ